MKNIFKFIILLPTLLLLLTGCNKFLEQQSQDELRPSTINDLIALMAGDGYPYQTTLNPFTEFMTDDIKCNGGQGQKDFLTVTKKGRAPYVWAKDVYQELLLPEGLATTTHLNTWQIIYGKISGCNTVLEYIDKVAGSDIEKNNLKGQALVMRAYYYFILVNTYGKPYNAPGVNPESTPGVPIKLSMAVTDSLYPRNSVEEVYNLIISNLNEGAQLMTDYPQKFNIYKMNSTAAYTLLSRVYLYQEKWKESIDAANAALATKSSLSQLSTFKARPSGGYYMFNNGTSLENSNRIYDPILSPEIIWAYRPIGPGTGTVLDEVFKSSISPGYSNTLNPPYSISDELMSLYETRPITDTAIYLGDLRSRTYFLTSLYFASTSPIAYGFKFYGGSYGVGGAGLRVAELYLNRAEAKIQESIKNANAALLQQALNDINTLRASRYDTRKLYVPINITNAEQLLSFCRDERRREFPLEGHRWFDLRRYGMPELTHYYEEVAGTGVTYTLSRGDNRYTLQIPNAVLERNGNLVQNP